MSVKLVNQEGKKYVFELEIELDDKSMLNSEEQIHQAVNDLWGLATGFAVQQFDTGGEMIIHAGRKMSSKGSQKKSTKRRMA